MKKKHIELPADIAIGKVSFALWPDEVCYTNPAFGEAGRVGDYEYTTQKQPILYIIFNKKTGGVSVTAEFTLQELRKLLRTAEKRTKKFKGEGHFVHAGNLSIFVKGRKR
jgi:hypothetical protein